MKHRVCIVTGTRAEYGLLRPLMREIEEAPGLDLQVVVTGMHLSPEFGLTWREIEADGFPIHERVEILLSSDTDVAVCKAMGLALISFGEVFARLDPHVVVGLGDRFELFAAVSAAAASRRMVAHIHGGELTEGAFDDAFRHAITKMSMLHFTSTETYRRRVIQLGESPDRVFDVGALGVDNIVKLPLLSRPEIEASLGFRLGAQTLLVTFHPVTLEANSAAAQVGELLAALDRLPEAHVVFTAANADPEGRVINAMIDAWVAQRGETARCFTSLGALRYLSLMKHADAVVGNSSSGIIEAPALRVPTVDIGDRQKGRVKAASVVACAPQRDAIEEALRRVLSETFRAAAASAPNPYGDGHAAERIRALLEVNLQRPLKKGFHDIAVD